VLRIGLNNWSLRLWSAVEVFGDFAEGKHFSRRLVSVKPDWMQLASHGHKRFPQRLAFILNNRIRRFLSPPEQLILQLGVQPNDVVVDFGCGPGFFTIPLARRAAKTIGVDVSPRMLETASSNAQKNGVRVEFVMSDGSEIKVEDRSVDLVLLVHVYHEIEDKQKALGEFSRILRENGRLTIVERVRGGIFSGRFGPPIMSEEQIGRDMELGGFTLNRTIPYGNDSIFVARKLAKMH